ncbi:hypothetical protein ACFV3R_32230 [Streptomyces sp. NPDC059740]|uniref:hypothetical protein n=1 Tax=Streptomyces sp. NPDC059740 TaxID=3346926 RepID=UPI00364C3FAB
MLCALLGLAAVLLPYPASAAVSPVGSPLSVRLAAELRRDPVYVTDQLPRSIPRSTAPRFAAAARTTGVPTYVLVLPTSSDEGGLLATVHDRLGRDGLYVLVDNYGVQDARAFGVDAPADDARAVALYSLPYDAGALRAFQVFAGAVAEGSERAAHRADALREASGHSERPDAYIDSTDRENQSFTTGLALTGLPLLVLLVSPYVRRQRHRARLWAPASALPGPRKGGRGPKKRTRRDGGGRPAAVRAGRGVHPVEWAVAGVLALAVLGTALLVFDQRYDGVPVSPTHADLTHRVARVAAGLRHDPVYLDPESQTPLDAAQLSTLRSHMRGAAPGPLYVVLVPSLPDDESAGDAGAFTTALHRRLGKDAVFVVADPVHGAISVADHGLPLDDTRLSLGLPESVTNGPSDDTAARSLPGRLVQAIDFVRKAPRLKHAEPDTTTRPEPLRDTRLPKLLSGDFWPGLCMGAVLAALLLGLVASVLGIAGLVERRRAPKAGGVPPTAPSEPSPAWLRHTARQELAALGAVFEAGKWKAPAIRERVWDLLDAALLLAGPDAGGRPAGKTSPGDLAAVVVLSRAGLAAAEGEARNAVCGVNPLHGTAVGQRRVVRSPDGRPVRTRLCAGCAERARRSPGSAAAEWLTLPAAHGRLPHDELDGVLPSVRDGLSVLVRTIRERHSVR